MSTISENEHKMTDWIIGSCCCTVVRAFFSLAALATVVWRYHENISSNGTIEFVKIPCQMSYLHMYLFIMLFGFLALRRWIPVCVIKVVQGIAIPLAFTVIVMYWALLFPAEGMRTTESKITNLTVHGIFPILTMAEFLMNRVPTPKFHLVWCGVFMVLYLVLLYLGSEVWFEQIYSVIDFKKGLTYGYLAGAICFFLLIATGARFISKKQKRGVQSENSVSDVEMV